MTYTPSTIARVFDAALTDRPSAEALRARSGSLTYAQLDAAAAAAAGGLWEWGIRPGDRVAGCLANDLDVVIAFHAVMRIGAIWVGINTALAPPERVHLIGACGARVILTGADWAGQARELLAARGSTTQVLVVDPTDTAADFSALVAAGHRPPSVTIDPYAPAGIAYTSGTTGEPKGIVHSQHNLLVPGAVLVATRGYDHTLVKGDCLPMTILNMMVLTTLLTAQAQGTCVVMDRRDIAGVVEWIADAGMTVFNGVPTQLWDLVRNPDVDPAVLGSLREIWSGAGDCSDDLRRAFTDRFGLDIRATYGLTEAPTIVAMDPPGEHWRAGSAGQVLPHLHVSSIDRDGSQVAPDVVGEIAISAARSGPWSGVWRPMVGTWSGTEVSESQTDTLATGDLGTVDDGWVSIVDRRKLMILRGGANVYPAEVERVLLALPGVASAAVFGIPDERLGERVAALVEPRESADGTPSPTPTELTAELTAACSERLARYKIPQTWGFVEALPRNAMGKIIRTELPELLSTAHVAP